MKNIEKRRINYSVKPDSGEEGSIWLEKLAIPSTVRVTVEGKRIVPISFDIFGQPVFSEEQCKLLEYEEQKLKEEKGDSKFELKAEVEYEEDVFAIPRSNFDSVKGIEESLDSLATIERMLNDRKRFHKANKDVMLNEFVVFGYIMLDCVGDVHFTSEKTKYTENVEIYHYFKQKNDKTCLFGTTNITIPKANSVCPCCGKTITIHDIKENPCVSNNGKYYHGRCWTTYRRNAEVKFYTSVINGTYNFREYKAEIVKISEEKPYYSEVIFYTVDGNIKMTRYGEFTTIEWMQNYKPFDVQRTFGELKNIVMDEKKRKVFFIDNCWTNAHACLYKARNAIKNSNAECNA